MQLFIFNHHEFGELKVLLENDLFFYDLNDLLRISKLENTKYMKDADRFLKKEKDIVKVETTITLPNGHSTKGERCFLPFDVAERLMLYSNSYDTILGIEWIKDELWDLMADGKVKPITF